VARRASIHEIDEAKADDGMWMTGLSACSVVERGQTLERRAVRRTGQVNLA
jgi:hypothetical protein